MGKIDVGIDSSSAALESPNRNFGPKDPRMTYESFSNNFSSIKFPGKFPLILSRPTNKYLNSSADMAEFD